MLAPATDPLTTLVDHLEFRSLPPLRWAIAHAPTGDLEPLWDRCDDPAAIVWLAARVAPSRGVARAVAGALAHVSVQRGIAVAAIDRALAYVERWAGGAGGADSFEVAITLLGVAASEARHVEELRLIEAAAELTSATRCRPANARWRLRRAVELGVAVLAATDREASAILADVVRADLPCPSLEDLLARR